MKSSMPPLPDVHKITLEIPADRSEAFTRLVHDFLAGGTRHDLEVRARGADRQQGQASLRELVKIAQGDSHQCRYIARFLAGLYNGYRFKFDLTDLRPIDDKIFEHCVAVLRMDHHPEKEVHCYFEKGGELWEGMIRDWSLDQEALKAAAVRLSEHLRDSDSAELRTLGQKIAALRFET